MCLLGVGVPVVASTLAHLNDNSRYNFKEEVNTELAYQPDDSLQGSEKTLQGVEIKMEEVERDGNYLYFVCTLCFDENIDTLVDECKQHALLYSSLTNARPFESSYIKSDGIDSRLEYLDDYTSTGFIANVLMADYNKSNNTIKLKIEVMGEKEYMDEQHQFEICFKDIIVGDKVLSGEFKYQYDYEPSIYAENEIIKQDINISGTTSATYDKETYKIDSYALTQNGIIFYGTKKSVLVHLKEWWDNCIFPQKSATARLYIKDNLGNEYLMYPVCVDDVDAATKMNPQTGDWDNVDDKNSVEDKELALRYEFHLYVGPAIYMEEGKNYQVLWHPDATEITVVMQEIVTEWETNTKYTKRYYQTFSEEVTIPLVGTTVQ